MCTASNICSELPAKILMPCLFACMLVGVHSQMSVIQSESTVTPQHPNRSSSSGRLLEQAQEELESTLPSYWAVLRCEQSLYVFCSLSGIRYELEKTGEEAVWVRKHYRNTIERYTFILLIFGVANILAVVCINPGERGEGSSNGYCHLDIIVNTSCCNLFTFL